MTGSVSAAPVSVLPRRRLAEPGKRAADPADFPFEDDAELRLDAAADLFAEPFQIGGGRIAGVDQEIGVLLRHHRAAAPQSATAGGVDQPPGAVARRIGKGRAAGARADRLR